jgi:hypothetical protein
VLIPRPNGSAGLDRVASFLAETLEHQGAVVSSHDFVATPHGFALVWAVGEMLATVPVSFWSGRASTSMVTGWPSARLAMSTSSAWTSI